MKREEIMRRIEEIETARFYLAMIDRWTRETYKRDNELATEERTLRAML